MCGRFDTSHLTWREIHDRLSSFIPVKTTPLNLEASADVRPTTSQLTARLDGWARGIGTARCAGSPRNKRPIGLDAAFGNPASSKRNTGRLLTNVAPLPCSCGAE
jgi:hypothetical protein